MPGRGWVKTLSPLRSRRNTSAPEQVPELFLPQHPFQFLERKEGDEGAKYHDTLPEQLIPALARELRKTCRQALPMEQSASGAFQDAEQPDPHAEHHGSEEGGQEQR